MSNKGYKVMALKKIDFYWSDRWWKVINVYRCTECGREMCDPYKTKPKLAKEHKCPEDTRYE